MTRKACLLLACFSQLVLLTGCQHVPYYFTPYRDTASKASDITHTNAVDVPANADVQGMTVVMEKPKSEPAVKPSVDPERPLSSLPILPVGLSSNKPKVGAGLGAVELDIKPTTNKQVDPQPAPTGAQKPREYAPLVQALQCMLDKRHEEAIQHLRAYDDETQQFFLRLLPALVVFVQKPIRELTPQEIAVLNNQLVGIGEELRKRSELVISRMCYCKRVNGFGSYSALPENHSFLAAALDRTGELVQVYVELKNFASEKEDGKDGEFVTKLSCSLELRDAKGEKVWSHNYDRNDTTQRRRTRLTDLHGNYSFYVPALPTGTYQLRMQIVDETTPGLRRVARKELDFRVTPVASQTPR